VAFVALLDASVLHPWVVCDLLLRLADRGLLRPAWSAEILGELVGSLARRRPEHEERYRRRRERMEAAFAEAMTHQPGRSESAVQDEVGPGDRHVVAAAFAANADVIVTNNVRHLAPEHLADSGLLVQTADEFLVHQWWLDPHGVDEVLAEMAAATARERTRGRGCRRGRGRVAGRSPGLLRRLRQEAPASWRVPRSSWRHEVRRSVSKTLK
jgi:predicted nucleic acid-binding protein